MEIYHNSPAFPAEYLRDFERRPDAMIYMHGNIPRVYFYTGYDEGDARITGRVQDGQGIFMHGTIQASHPFAIPYLNRPRFGIIVRCNNGTSHAGGAVFVANVQIVQATMVDQRQLDAEGFIGQPRSPHLLRFELQHDIEMVQPR
ncbi:hypothetical protein GCM10011505_40550 [Tistrella bauzanensis]|uniref:Uncharacterized protein n=1 Tax=Tistrella bauzanensis TaxID=657419 RepID=A0ABQ1IYU2_9PROT|nr:hypothetical protein GCM10011505_40550 [Tistrella bauzanensis]